MKRKLLKCLFVGVVISAPFSGFGQVSQQTAKQQNEEKLPDSKKMSLSEYCEQNAIQLIDVPADKMSSVKISGTLDFIDPKKGPGLKAYGVKPADNETTYYKLNGSDKLLAVKSMYILKLNYANAKN